MVVAVRPQKNVPFLLRKITPKEVTEKIGEINLLELTRPVASRILYEIYGHARSATIIPDKSGTKKDSVRFAGEFKAITPDEYVFESGRCFIPVLEEYLYSALKSAQEQEPGAYLEIALSIGIDPAPSGKPSMTGYEFNVQRLIQSAPKKDDPIARLMAEAANQKKLLAAPTAGATSGPADTSNATSTLPRLSTASSPADVTAGSTPAAPAANASSSQPSDTEHTPSSSHSRSRSRVST